MNNLGVAFMFNTILARVDQKPLISTKIPYEPTQEGEADKDRNIKKPGIGNRIINQFFCCKEKNIEIEDKAQESIDEIMEKYNYKEDDDVDLGYDRNVKYPTGKKIEKMQGETQRLEEKSSGACIII